MITTAVVNVATKKPSAAANAVAIKTVKRSQSAAAKVASAARATQSNRSSLQGAFPFMALPYGRAVFLPFYLSMKASSV